MMSRMKSVLESVRRCLSIARTWLQLQAKLTALYMRPISGSAHIVVMDGFISMGGTNIHPDTLSFTVTHSTELVEDTVFADNFHQRLIGLQDYQVAFECENDHADDALDEDIEALIATNFAVAWRASDGAISTSNPEYQFTGSFSSITKTYAMGQIAKISGTIMMTTTASVTRDTTP